MYIQIQNLTKCRKHHARYVYIFTYILRLKMYIQIQNPQRAANSLRDIYMYTYIFLFKHVHTDTESNKVPQALSSRSRNTQKSVL